MDGCTAAPVGEGMLIFLADDISTESFSFCCRYKLFVPGNHDYTLDPEYYGERGLWSRLHSSPRFSSLAEADACLAGTVILRDCSVSLHGLNFHGFPHIPEPHGRKMAFCHDLIAEGKPTPTMDAPLSKVPHDTDVLAVHGPAYKFLDQIAYGKRSVGSASLREWVLQHRPAVVACGHIHEARGVLRDAASSVTFVNAACLTHQYRRIENAATVMDIGIPVSEGAHGHALREGPSSSEGGVPKCACEAQGEVPPDALPEPRSTAMHASNPQERIDITDPQYVPLLHRDGAA